MNSVWILALAVAITVTEVSGCLSIFKKPSANSGSGNGGNVRGCYYTSWARYRPDKGAFTPENYQPGLCTHMFYAFAVMGSDFQVKDFDQSDEDTFKKLVNIKKGQQPDLKLILSIGGWRFCQDQGGNNLFKTMSSSAANRATFAKSASAFVRRIGFDGFDIDWEYPEAADKANYAALIKDLRAHFDQEAQQTGKPRLLLTAAVAGSISKIDAGYDGAQLGHCLDYLNIMSYDFHGGWDPNTGFNSPLNDRNGDQLSISNAAKHWNQVGVPNNKILIGLATYGRGFNLADKTKTNVGAAARGASAAQKYTQEPGYAAYYEVCDLIDNKGYKEFYDDQQQSPYAVGSDGVWIGYDNVRSFNAKLDWVKSGGYGGAFVWTLDLDDFQGQCRSSGGKKYPLLNAIKAKLG